MGLLVTHSVTWPTGAAGGVPVPSPPKRLLPGGAEGLAGWYREKQEADRYAEWGLGAWVPAQLPVHARPQVSARGHPHSTAPLLSAHLRLPENSQPVLAHCCLVAPTGWWQVVSATGLGERRCALLLATSYFLSSRCRASKRQRIIFVLDKILCLF